MSPRKRPSILTAPNVERAKPGSKRIEVRDGLLPNFWLFIHPSGRKSFGVRYSLGGRRVKHILGSYPGLGLAAARDKARKVFEQLEAGHDPRAPEAEAATVADAVTLYQERHVAKLRPTTAQYVKRELAIASDAWRGRALASITRRDVIALTDQIEKRGQNARNTSLKVLSSFFRFCEGRDLIGSSPARGMKRLGTMTRDRILSDAELAIVWKHADAFVKLLILTGCRRNEIAKLEWSEVGADVIELPPDKTKTAMRLRVPITPAMRRILDDLPRRGCYVLKGAKPLHVSGTTAGFGVAEHWTLHDLRRSFASGLQRLGIRFEVIEAALNHKVKGIAGTYQKYDFEPEIKAALEKWSNHLIQITAAS